MSDLVTGEGVALDLRLAKLPSRALAKLVDLLAQTGVAVVLVMVLGALASNVDRAVATALALIFFILLVLGYPVFFESILRGRTPGKMALGLRVLRTDGGPVRFQHALVRGLTGIFDFFVTFGLLAVVTSFCSKHGRRTGDVLAGTVVVRERTPDSGVSPAGMAALAMPYPLLPWAQSLELAVLPDDLALAARQFLTRMYELRPEIAARMGYDLMMEVARYIPQPPPQGTPPWAYLAAVTAERRAREMRKVDEERRAAWERQQRAAQAGPTMAYTQQHVASGGFRPSQQDDVPVRQDADGSGGAGANGGAVTAPVDVTRTAPPRESGGDSGGDAGFKPPV